jgi:hypothetical protein
LRGNALECGQGPHQLSAVARRQLVALHLGHAVPTYPIAAHGAPRSQTWKVANTFDYT